MTPRKTTTTDEPLEGTPEPDAPEPGTPEAEAEPTPEAELDPVQAKIDADAAAYRAELDADDEKAPELRPLGSGPQSVDGYDPPPAVDKIGVPPVGFDDAAFTLKTGPTSPSIVDQQALAAIAEHAPDAINGRPKFHD